MHRFVNASTGLLACSFLLMLGVGASCSVDTDGLIFRDTATSTGGLGGDGNGATGGLGGGADLGCEHGELGCQGAQVQICAAGEWFPAGAECEFACVAGLCVGSCEPDSTQCASSSAQRTCSSVGMWGAEEECQFACVDGACGGVCKPGATRCDDLMPQRCNDQGAWENERENPCLGECTGGVCVGACEATDPPQCAAEPYHVQACADGQWSAPQECVGQVCIMGACTGVCRPGNTTCSSSTHRQVCNTNGEFGTPSECPNACVGGEGGDCGGVCKPGATRCDGTTVQTCSSAGQWQNSQVCSGGTPLCATSGGESFCASCQPGSRRCDYAFVEVCNATGTGWSRAKTACETACYQGSCVDERVCKLSTFPVPKGCNSELEVWTCTKGTFQAGTCLKGNVCDDGSCVASTGTGGRIGF
jgi:hypothetical protein